MSTELGPLIKHNPELSVVISELASGRATENSAAGDVSLDSSLSSALNASWSSSRAALAALPIASIAGSVATACGIPL